MVYYLWESIMVYKHNAENPMVFMAVILQKCRTVKKAKDVQSQVTQILEIWRQGHFKALIQET